MTRAVDLEDIMASINKLTEAVDNLHVGSDKLSGIRQSIDEHIADTTASLAEVRNAIENVTPILALMALTPYAAANPKAQKTCETLMIYVGSQAEEQEWFKRIQQIRKRASDIVDHAFSESNAKVEKSAVST